MNYLIVSAFIVFGTINSAKAQEPTIQEPYIQEIKMSERIPEPPKEKFKPTENMISVNPLFGKYTVKLGQQVYYAANVHSSVGYSAAASSSDSDALPLNRCFVEYDNEQERGATGGDSATKYFIFDVKKTGTYEIVVAGYFRGELENEYTITVTVI